MPFPKLDVPEAYYNPYSMGEVFSGSFLDSFKTRLESEIKNKQLEKQRQREQLTKTTMDMIGARGFKPDLQPGQKVTPEEMMSGKVGFTYETPATAGGGMIELPEELRTLWKTEFGYDLPKQMPKGIAGMFTSALGKNKKSEMDKIKLDYQIHKDDLSTARWAYDTTAEEMAYMPQQIGADPEKKKAVFQKANELFKEMTGKDYKGFENFIKKENKPEVIVSPQNKIKATKWLQDNNAPVTDANIRDVIKKMGW